MILDCNLCSHQPPHYALNAVYGSYRIHVFSGRGTLFVQKKPVHIRDERNALSDNEQTVLDNITHADDFRRGYEVCVSTVRHRRAQRQNHKHCNQALSKPSNLDCV